MVLDIPLNSKGRLLLPCHVSKGTTINDGPASVPATFFFLLNFLCNPKPTEVKLNPLYISVADICALGNTAYELLAQLLQWAGGNGESLALTCTRDWSGFVKQGAGQGWKTADREVEYCPFES